MKKYILSVLPLLALSMGFVGCDDDNAIQKESVITVDSYVQNNFDKWLELNYILPYNIDFKYRYEEIESDFDYYTVPADMTNSIKMAHLVKYLCIESYNEVAGVDFTCSYFPKEFYLIGEFEYRNNGTMTLGTAEGGRKIILMGVNHLTNDVITDPETLNELYIKTIHHEFTHILNQTRNYPTSFKQVTPSKYVKDSWSKEPYGAYHCYKCHHDMYPDRYGRCTYEDDENNVCRSTDICPVWFLRGFITNYAQMEDREDFAEMLSTYITNDATWWEDTMKKAENTWENDPDQTITGRELIEQKLDIVREYMQDVFNIDIDVLRDAIIRRQNDIMAGKIDLTNIDL